MALGLCSGLASGSVWERAKNPAAGRAETLALLAEQSRVPREPGRYDAEDLEVLNKRSALMLELASAERYDDEQLAYLFADTLFEAGAGFEAKARAAILRALSSFPTSPHAGEAWANLGALEREVDRAPAARDAYTSSLGLTWSDAERAELHILRAEAHMMLGDVEKALSDYRMVLGLAAPGELVVRAEWGAAVAYERSFDLPRALAYARRASRVLFGAPPTQMGVLDLPGTTFHPAYEEHYYRALAEMAEAEVETDPKRAAERFQTAAFLWSLYVADARRAAWGEEGVVDAPGDADDGASDPAAEDAGTSGAPLDEPRWVANALRHQRSATERSQRLGTGRR